MSLHGSDGGWLRKVESAFEAHSRPQRSNKLELQKLELIWVCKYKAKMNVNACLVAGTLEYTINKTTGNHRGFKFFISSRLRICFLDEDKLCFTAVDEGKTSQNHINSKCAEVQVLAAFSFLLCAHSYN